MSEEPTPYTTVLTTNIHLVPEPEPADQLSPRDVEVLRSALHLYYGEMADCYADLSDLQRIAALSRRIASVDVTWKAERHG